MKKSTIVIVIAVVLFVGLGVYLANDYTRRCVKITPKKDISEIEVDKTYSIEDFFLIEREKNTDERIIGITWADGSSDNIEIDKDGHFTVTKGFGPLTVSLTDRNSDSPESTRASVTVTVRRKSIIMPDIIGMPYLEAQELLRAEFEKIGVYFICFSITWVDYSPFAGKVAEQNPKAGEILYEGDEDHISVTVGEAWY